MDIKEKSIRRLRKQADGGDPQAQYKAAYYLASRSNADRYRRQCVDLLKASATQGNRFAQYALGNWYIHGIGVRKNYKAAYLYFLSSAKQEHALAQYNLGVSLEKGKGV